MRYFIICLLISFSCLIGCRVYNELSFNRIDYLSNNLRIDGYYYRKFNSEYYPIFFYENGIVYKMGIFSEVNNIEELDNQIRKNISMYGTTQVPFFWGVFKVEGNSIEINHWLTGTGSTYPAKLVKGKITDPMNLELNWGEDILNNTELNYWKFREFSPKPDSTNRFIK